jgi:hypothetical protein
MISNILIQNCAFYTYFALQLVIIQVRRVSHCPIKALTSNCLYEIIKPTIFECATTSQLNIVLLQSTRQRLISPITPRQMEYPWQVDMLLFDPGMALIHQCLRTLKLNCIQDVCIFSTISIFKNSANY